MVAKGNTSRWSVASNRAGWHGRAHSGVHFRHWTRHVRTALASAVSLVSQRSRDVTALRVHPDGDQGVAANIAVPTMPISASASFGGCGARIKVGFVCCTPKYESL